MIKRISLKFGHSLNSQPENVDLTPITLFVGPNNSGKSLMLSELKRFFTETNGNIGSKMIESLEYNVRTEEEAHILVNKIKLDRQSNETIYHNSFSLYGKNGSRMQVPESEMISVVKNPNTDPSNFATRYLQFYTIF